MGDEPEQGDLYSRVDYRRVIAWEARIRREGPFLLRLLADAPDDSVLDLGCGTGEHVAFFAEQVKTCGQLLAGQGDVPLGCGLSSRHQLGTPSITAQPSALRNSTSSR